MSRDDDGTRVRLEEVLDDVRTLDRQLIQPLTLGTVIKHLEDTIEAYDRIGEDIREQE